MNISTIENNFKQIEIQKLLNSKSDDNSSTHLNITSLQSLFLQNFIKSKNPKTILEFGTYNGYSLFSMILGVIKSEDILSKQFTSVEINEENFNIAKKNLQILKNEGISINLINKSIFDEKTLNTLCLQKYDFIFIDCMQNEYPKVLEVINKNNLLSECGIMLFENILSHSTNYDFYEELNKNDFYTVTLYPIHNGFMAVEKNN